MSEKHLDITASVQLDSKTGKYVATILTNGSNMSEHETREALRELSKSILNYMSEVY